jgi:hypothetical protein
MKPSVFLLTFFVLLLSGLSYGKDLETNEFKVMGAPNWLKQSRVEKVTMRIQSRLEWTIRKSQLHWYHDQIEFEKVHGLGPMAAAVTQHKGGTSAVHMGPTISDANFDELFGHELVHVIIQQKYKGAIPKWLEEGLANHLAKRGKVDYKWLSQQPLPQDVKELAHPFKGQKKDILYSYKASQALAEMLDKKCGLENLIRLSVERKMENYIVTYCEIKDLNLAFRDWVKKRAALSP